MDAIIAVDDTQRIVLFNAAAERVFACPANEAIGCSVERFVPERSRAGHSARVHCFAESGVTNRTLGGLGTLWGLRATGEEFPMEASISKVECGGQRYFTVVIRDITERHRAEKAAAESEQRFRLVADTAPVLIWMSGTDKLCNYFNKTWLEFTGRSLEEELGNGWAEGVHPDDLERCLQTYTQSFERRERFEMEYRLRQRDGEYRWIFDVGVPRYSEDGSFAGYIGSCVDVTERKRTDEARFRHAAIVESSEDAIASTNLDGIIESWNRGAQRIFGYTEREAIGNSVTMLVPPDRPNEENEILETLKTGGRLDQFETVRVTKTGKRINVSLSISAIKDSTGKTVGFSGISRDIGDQKKQEEKLREYERAVENAEDMIGVVDREYRFLLANGEYLKLRKKTKEQVVGHLVPDVMNKEMFETVVKPKLDECFKGNVVRYESKFSYPGVGEKYLSLAYFPIAGTNGIDRAVCILRDITERKQAEEAMREMNRALTIQTEALRSQEELLKIYVKNVPAGVAMLDREMRYLQVSDRWCADYCVDASQVLARSHYELFPDIPPRWKEMHRRALEGETFRAEEDRWDRQGGFATWVRWEIRPWKSSSGNIGGILIFAEDITQRKHAEEDLSGMTRKVIEAQEQERTRIARDLHDDIAQRLVLLTIDLEELSNKAMDDRLRTSLGELNKRVSDMVTDVQSLSHELYSSKLEYLGLSAAVKGFCDEYSVHQRAEIEFSSHDLPTDIPPEISLCLFRVLQQALQNAVKHSGVKHFEVQLWGTQTEIRLTVRDLGVGFDVEAALKSQGIGLSSMTERTRLVGGELSIDSHPRRGTTIHVRVPFRPSGELERAAG